MRRDAPESPSRLLADGGCCGSCRHAELKTAVRSVYVWCRRSKTDSRFPKFPQLPVIECPGHERFPRPGDPDESC